MDINYLTSLGMILFCFFTCESTATLRTYYMDELCRSSSPETTTIRVGSTYSGSNSSAIIKNSRHGSYESGFRCVVNLEPSPGNGLVVAFKKIDFRTLCLDRLTLTDSRGHREVFCSFHSDSTESMVFYSDGKITLRFRSSSLDSFTYSGFELAFTATRVGVCSSSEYDCKNRRCISKVLICNGHNHCGNRNDQLQCDDPGAEEGMSFGLGIVVAVIVLAVLVTSGIAGIMLYCSTRKSYISKTIILLPQQQQPCTAGYAPPSYGSISPPSERNYPFAPAYINSAAKKKVSTMKPEI